MKVLGVLFILSSSIPFYLGIDKMLAYKNSSRFSLNEMAYISDTTAINAYVGGDAYNLIINSNYFTGFMVMALILVAIGSTMLICNSIAQSRIEK
jgi:hypothetical protein